LRHAQAVIGPLPKNKLLNKMHKIYYMMSFSRSGETLLQRHLSQNNELHIGFNLNFKDVKNEIRLNKYLRLKNPSELSELEAHKFGITKRKIIAKAIWPNRNQRGFILARHPLPIIASVASKYNQVLSEDFGNKIDRICSYVNALYGTRLSKYHSLDDIVLKLAVAYSHRMRIAFESGDPIVHYELFVNDHESVLKKICVKLGININNDMIFPERNFGREDVGHGGFKLNSPVDKSKAFLKINHLSQHQIDTVLYVCAESMELYGYTENINNEMINELCDDRFF